MSTPCGLSSRPYLGDEPLTPLFHRMDMVHSPSTKGRDDRDTFASRWPAFHQDLYRA
jgi:hypothetical protein